MTKPEPPEDARPDELRARLREHLQTYPGLTVCAIARALGIEKSSVKTRLKAMHADGEAVPETTPKTATTKGPVTTWTVTDSRITNPDAAVTAARKETSWGSGSASA
jgi:predicted ArsR family transcriptional regulator